MAAAGLDLLRAAQEGDLNRVQHLLKGKADVNCYSLSGLTPLHYAAAKGWIQLVEVCHWKGSFHHCSSHPLLPVAHMCTCISALVLCKPLQACPSIYKMGLSSKFSLSPSTRVSLWGLWKCTL